MSMTCSWCGDRLRSGDPCAACRGTDRYLRLANSEREEMFNGYGDHGPLSNAPSAA